MSEFAYKAIGPDGQEELGSIAAVSKNAALAELFDRGLSVYQIGSDRDAAPPAWYNREISLRSQNQFRRSLAELCDVLATLLRAGVTIAEAMKISATIINHRGLSQALSDDRA